MTRLDGRVAIVTGGSRGIGAAVCRAYAREGARVVVNYFRRADLAEALVRDIRNTDGEAIAVRGDVSRQSDVQRLVEATHDAFGPVDILVCNAAHYPRRPWHEIQVDEWDRVLAVNLRGALLCAQAVYPGMRHRGSGVILTVSSVTAELGWGPFLHYVTSKAGLIGFTRSLAREVGGEGVRVNCVMPGDIRTEQEIADFPDQIDLAEAMAQRQCLPRRGLPEDVAGAFVYLASDEASFVTGQVVTVDGGWIHY